MESGLNTILIISLILVTGLVVTFMVFLIQILKIAKRVLTKIELRIDHFELTQEEIKLKILNFLETLIEKVVNFKKVSSKKYEGGGKTNEKER